MNLDFSGLLGFEHLDPKTNDMQSAVADTFNKIGELKAPNVLPGHDLDVSGLLGFEHLDPANLDTQSAIADAFNKIGEIKPPIRNM